MPDKQRTVAKIMCSNCKGTGTGPRGYEICPVCGGTGFIYDHEEVSEGKNMTGAELIAQERQRQIEDEGYTDDSYSTNEQLAKAAVCYALPDTLKIYDRFGKPFLWPWHTRHYKPTPGDRIRELVKAGALIAAEIDRLQAVKK
ncbi:MAG: hypothetical protein K2N07_00720 [Desulfovibrio sp.]|nr:hypothetical protein [Desulfovibrio sp.]